MGGWVCGCVQGTDVQKDDDEAKGRVDRKQVQSSLSVAWSLSVASSFSVALSLSATSPCLLRCVIFGARFRAVHEHVSLITSCVCARTCVSVCVCVGACVRACQRACVCVHACV